MFLGLIIFLIAVANAIIGSLTYWPVQHGYDFYIPIVLLIGTYIGAVMISWIYYEIVGRILLIKKNRTKISKCAFIHLHEGIRYICDLARVKVDFIGKEKIPTNEKFLFVCNHLSKFDPMISYCYFKKNLSFITKPSNMKIPLGGKLMRTLFFLPIDRNDKLQSLQVMNKATELIANDITSVGVYPEGTRSQDGSLGEFHAGVFTIAQKAKCPIVVSSIKGTENIHSNFPFKRTYVKHEIITVIPYEEIESRNIADVSNDIKDMIEESLKEHATDLCEASTN